VLACTVQAQMSVCAAHCYCLFIDIILELLAQTSAGLSRDGFTLKGRHLLPWHIELVIDEPVGESEEEPEV
jgi:hypothetical protein